MHPATPLPWLPTPIKSGGSKSPSKNAVPAPPHTEETPASDPVEAAIAVVETVAPAAKVVVDSRRTLVVEEVSRPVAVEAET